MDCGVWLGADLGWLNTTILLLLSLYVCVCAGLLGIQSVHSCTIEVLLSPWVPVG